jgi:predicted secreted protein
LVDSFADDKFQSSFTSLVNDPVADDCSDVEMAAVLEDGYQYFANDKSICNTLL